VQLAGVHDNCALLLAQRDLFRIDDLDCHALLRVTEAGAGLLPGGILALFQAIVMADRGSPLAGRSLLERDAFRLNRRLHLSLCFDA
jgi:hypothetical protein